MGGEKKKTFELKVIRVMWTLVLEEKTVFRFFQKKNGDNTGHNSGNNKNEQLVPFPVPALVETLKMIESQKGAPLTENEVIEARDKCACIMLPVSEVEKMNASRGYSDLSFENAWKEWQQARRQ